MGNTGTDSDTMSTTTNPLPHQQMGGTVISQRCAQVLLAGAPEFHALKEQFYSFSSNMA